jgi:ABC-type uncharacterized transport system substrate-binding protein
VLPKPGHNWSPLLIIALAARYRSPAIYAHSYFVTEGGLMSCGIDLARLYPRAADYVDRILKGAKPADLRAVCEPGARRPKEPTFLIEFKLSPVVLVEGTCDRGIVREC